MKLKDLLDKTTLKEMGREIGLDVQMVNGELVCKALDPNDPRYSTDFILPSMKMVDACRADDFEFFHPFIDAGKLTVEQMHHAAERYYLGKTKNGQPIFWMIDDLFEPLDAHIGNNWISKFLIAREPIVEYWHFERCLFGLHLLSMNQCVRSSVSSIPISIVEREEAAVVLSELFPESIWMAYATTPHLTLDLFASLKGCNVTFYPRTDPNKSNYLFFCDLADSIRQHDPTIDISVDSLLEGHATEDQKSRCIDLLEFLLESIHIIN